MLKLCGILFLALTFALCGCATTYNPATEQREFVFVTTAMEESIGNVVAGKISTQFKISKDEKKISRLTDIGKKVASVSDRKDLKYKFSVIENEDLNAFTTPGGYIYVNSGVLEKTSDDELACVIGHEIGHVAARHIAKKLQAQIGYDILMNIAASRGGLGDLQRAASVSFNLVMLGYSRQDESLSDRLGVKYAYRAGYDPYAMITFLEKLKTAEKKSLGPVFLRSHPYVSERIKMMQLAIPTITDKVDKKASEANVVRTQRQEPVNTLASSVVADEKRPLKVMCPVCRRIFSGKTRYCPYDGTKLE